MSIPLPNLDDRTYAELTAEAQSLIPGLYPAWTDHNPSDPGIVLVELFAWLTEMLLFQVNELPAASIETFLELLNGPQWTRPEAAGLDEAVRRTVLGLRERYRAVTPDDYEFLALNTWSSSEAAERLREAGRVRRARCVPRRDLSAADPAVRRAPAPAHVSLVVVPDAPEDYPSPQDALQEALHAFFDARRTLATHHHVVGPEYVAVEVVADLALREDAPPEEALAAARQALGGFFHPLTGGPDGTGWPFGRTVYVSEVYAVLERVPLLDYVEDVRIATPAGADRLQTDAGRAVGITLDAHELVRLAGVALVAYDVFGNRYR